MDIPVKLLIVFLVFFKCLFYYLDCKVLLLNSVLWFLLCLLPLILGLAAPSSSVSFSLSDFHVYMSLDLFFSLIIAVAVVIVLFAVVILPGDKAKPFSRRAMQFVSVIFFFLVFSVGCFLLFAKFTSNPDMGFIYNTSYFLNSYVFPLVLGVYLFSLVADYYSKP